MSPSTTTDFRISEFTLALLEGTGWYEVNYNMSDPFDWGRGKGCAFLDGPCVDENAEPNFAEFCSPLAREGCSYTRRAVGYCGGGIILNPPIYPQWDYWKNGTILLDTYADNCPYYVGTYIRNCENTTSELYAVLREESFGPTSRCFTGTLTQSSTSDHHAYCFSTKVNETFK